MLTVALTFAILLTALAAAAQAAHKGRPGPRAQVAIKLNRELADTPMRGSGFAFEAAGHAHRVHPALMVAIAGVESSYGAAACRNDRFNVAGLGSCGSSWTPPRFRSWRHFAGYFARLIRGHWPRAHTPYDMHGYCVDRYGNDCPTWAPKVAGNMRRLGFAAAVRYP